jgi:hypothetical protein
MLLAIFLTTLPPGVRYTQWDNVKGPVYADRYLGISRACPFRCLIQHLALLRARPTRGTSPAHKIALLNGQGP